MIDGEQLTLTFAPIVPARPTMTHWWRLRATLPERYGQPCRIVAVGKMNSIGIAFFDGEQHVVSRYAVRRLVAAQLVLAA
jgi:hypothetical protein